MRKRLDAGHSVVLEIEVQGARQVRAAMRESIQVFIAPPDPRVLRKRLESRGADSAEAIDARLEVAEQELAAQGEFAHWSSTPIWSAPRPIWRGSCAPSSACR